MKTILKYSRLRVQLGLDSSCQWITGPDGTRNYCWIHIGPATSNDNITIFIIAVCRASISFGWKKV